MTQTYTSTDNKGRLKPAVREPKKSTDSAKNWQNCDKQNGVCSLHNHNALYA